MTELIACKGPEEKEKMVLAEYMDKMTGVKGCPTEVKGSAEHKFYKELETPYRKDWKKSDNVNFGGVPVSL